MPAKAISQSAQIFGQPAITGRQVIRRGRRHVLDGSLHHAHHDTHTSHPHAESAVATPAIGAAPRPRCLGARSGRAGIQPGPRCVGSRPEDAVRLQVEHGPHGAGLLIDAQLLGKRKGALQRSMQCRTAQQRRGFQQEIPLELMAWFKPVIHSAQRLFHQYTVLRIDKALLHGCA